MRLGLLVDYANLFHSIKNIGNNTLEAEILNLLRLLLEYLRLSCSRLLYDVEVPARKLIVLNEKQFGTPEVMFSQIGFETIRVTAEPKSSYSREMNLSREDDSRLMEEGFSLAKTLDGIVLVSNDGDFSSLGEKVRFMGKRFIVASFETRHNRLSMKLRRIADAVIPLHDIQNQVDEPDAIPIDEEEIEASTASPGCEHLSLYCHGNIVFRYPMDRELIEIGRRSIRLCHLPHIDLTDYDREKSVSRQHCVIYKLGTEVILQVHVNCSQGTWINGVPVMQGEAVAILPEDQIVLGSNSKIGILLCGASH